MGRGRYLRLKQSRDTEHGWTWLDKKEDVGMSRKAEFRIRHPHPKTQWAPEKQLPQDRKKGRTEPEGLGLGTRVGAGHQENKE